MNVLAKNLGGFDDRGGVRPILPSIVATDKDGLNVIPGNADVLATVLARYSASRASVELLRCRFGGFRLRVGIGIRFPELDHASVNFFDLLGT